MRQAGGSPLRRPSGWRLDARQLWHSQPHPSCRPRAPMPLEPGRRYQVRIQLNDVGYAFPPWPPYSPGAVQHLLAAHLAVARAYAVDRIRRRSDAYAAGTRAAPEDDLEPFLAAEASTPEPRTTLRRGRSSRNLSHDIVTGETIFLLADDYGRVRIDRHGLEIGSSREHEYRITEGDPLSARPRLAGPMRWAAEAGRSARRRGSR